MAVTDLGPRARPTNGAHTTNRKARHVQKPNYGVRRRRTFALAITATVALAACGSSKSSSSAGTTAAQAGAATTAAGSKAAPLLTDKKKLSFGALWETPPMIGVAANDTTKPVGVTPDIAAAMAPLLGIPVEWQNMQWPAQLPGVQAGNVDALFGQVTITKEREQSIVDLVPFFKSTMAVLVAKDNPKKLTKLGDACGLSIGVPVGSIQTKLLTDLSASVCKPAGKPDIKAAEYQGANAAISAIQAGTVDGWVDNQNSIRVAAKTASLGVVPIPESEYPADYTGIAVGKSQPNVTKALASALKTLIENGTYAKILASYGLEDSAITADQVVINPLTKTAVGVKAG